MTSRQSGTALITGANRGIGLELAKQLASAGWNIIATARSHAFPEKARADLLKRNERTQFLQLDITESRSIEALAQTLREQEATLDLLINNAGIFLDQGESILAIDEATLQSTYRTNTVGPIMVTRAVAPFLESSSRALVINLSSAAACLSEMKDWSPAYSLSKTALNAATRQLAGALSPRGIAVCAVSPGWVRTEMGGPDAPRSVEEAAESILALVREPPQHLAGRFLRDSTDLPW